MKFIQKLRELKMSYVKNKRLFLWQLRCGLLMSTVYSFYYFCKSNITIALPLMRVEFQWTHYQIGWITSALLIVYCVGQFINGWLGDKYGPRKIVSIGGFGSAIANFIFSIGTGLPHFIGLWGINGYFSSMGWSPGCRLIYNWFPEKVRGLWMGIYNAFCYVGGAIVFPIAGLCALHFGWRSIFQIPPMFLLGATILFFFLVRNDPKDVGLEPPWRKKEEIERAIGKKEKGQYFYAFTHPRMNLAYGVACLTNFIRYTLLIWVPMYLFEQTGMGIWEAAIVANATNIGAIVFCMVSGVVSDRVFKGQRWQTISIGFLFSAIAIFAFGSMPGASAWVLMVLLFLAGGLIQGIQTPLFNLPGDILGRASAGTGSGIMDGWMYAGAILTGFAMGYFIDVFGFRASFNFIGVVALIGAGLILPVRR